MNRQVEVTNKTIVGTLKNKLEERKGVYTEELFGILWAYKTTIKIPTGEMPFTLTYGSEVVILVEIKIPSHRTQNFDTSLNIKVLEPSLDLVD